MKCICFTDLPEKMIRGLWSDTSLGSLLAIAYGKLSSHSSETKILSNFSKVGKSWLLDHVNKPSVSWKWIRVNIPEYLWTPLFLFLFLPYIIVLRVKFNLHPPTCSKVRISTSNFKTGQLWSSNSRKTVLRVNSNFWYFREHQNFILFFRAS